MECVVHNDKIYLIAGALNKNGFVVYDPALDTWMDDGEFSQDLDLRSGFAAHSLGDRIHIIGGFKERGGVGGVVDRVFAMDPLTGAITPKAFMPTPRYGTAHVLIDGKVMLFGGPISGKIQVDTAEAYFPEFDN